MHAVTLIILIAWLLFWIYWLAASSRARTGRTRGGRFVALRAAIVLVVLLLVRARALRGQTVTDDPWLQGAGLAVFACGLALAVWARLNLGRNWGTPMSEKDDPELVTSGPYRRIRHPIYSGIILAMVGTAVALDWSWLIAAGVLGAYFVCSAVMEERYMSARFPDAYPAYKLSTKMLIPFVF